MNLNILWFPFIELWNWFWGTLSIGFFNALLSIYNSSMPEILKYVLAIVLFVVLVIVWVILFIIIIILEMILGFFTTIIWTIGLIIDLIFNFGWTSAMNYLLKLNRG